MHRPGVPSWCPPLAKVTAACVWPFDLDRHVPAVRKHGYLLATVVTKGTRDDLGRDGIPGSPTVASVRR